MPGSHDDHDLSVDEEASLDQDSRDNLSLESAPDGGWGWMVVIAVFFGNFLIDGCAGSFGILLPELLDEFKASESVTSMAGSLIVAVYLFSSPLVGSLVNKFGCRLVCFVGGCVVTGGFIISTMAENIYVFMLTFGVLGGLGLGLNSLSGHVMVNSYFNKRRGIAGGIVSSGAGFGVFVCAPLLQLLIFNYSWRGAVLIFSGVMMQFCVCAALMRPLEENNRYKYSEESQTEDEKDSCDGAQQVPLMTSCDESKGQNYSNNTVSQIKEDINAVPNNSLAKGRGVNGYFLSTLNIHSEKDSEISNINSLPDLSKCGKGAMKGKISNDFVRRKVVSNGNGHQYHNENDTHHHDHHQHDHHHHHNKKHLNPLLRKDIFYSGSLYQLSEFQNADSVASFVHSMVIPVDESQNAEQEDDMRSKTCLSTLRKCMPRRNVLCDVSIFKNSVYIPMLLGATFIQMGQFIPSTFIPKYCITIGLEESQMSTIISVYGALNIFGRLSAGALANVPWISPLWICNAAMFMCALCCALFPLCTSFSSLLVYAVGFGFFIGYFPPLQVLIMVQYLGLDRLTSSVGFMQMVKGPAALIGPPLAGVVYEWTNDYAMSMEFAALLFLLSAIVQSLVPLIDKYAGIKKRDKALALEIEVSDPDS